MALGWLVRVIKSIPDAWLFLSLRIKGSQGHIYILFEIKKSSLKGSQKSKRSIVEESMINRAKIEVDGTLRRLHRDHSLP